MIRATPACTFSTCQLAKVVRAWCALYILTWKCASRHKGVHSFDVSTSKSGPSMVCFVHFDFGNVLRARTACTFSTCQLPKVVRAWCVLYILTSTCASRHHCVHFSISHLTTWLRTRRFSEPTSRACWATNHWKNTVFCDFATFRAPLPFAHLGIFFLLTLSLL